MFLSEGIIQNFIEAIEEEDMLCIEAIKSDDEVYKYIANLYKKSYGVPPSGVGVYLLRTKFNLGTERDNLKYVPSGLI
jgi:hypothetical protein